MVSDETAERESRFAGLVERRSRFAFRIAYAILRNPYDAEDVVQETLLKLYRTNAWSSMRDERAFLARAVWRMAVERLPRIRHDPLDPEITSDDRSTPEDDLIEADRNAVVHRLIDALPEELRQPLALSTVEELTSREIAQIMGIAEGTVRTRLLRARQILKLKLAGLQEGRHEKR